MQAPKQDDLRGSRKTWVLLRLAICLEAVNSVVNDSIVSSTKVPARDMTPSNRSDLVLDSTGLT